MAHPLSYSRAKTFEECPAKFAAEYLSGRRGGGIAESYLIVGNIVHECCDQYVKHLVVTHQSSDFAQMDAIFEGVWESELRVGLPESSRSEVYNLCVMARERLVFVDISVVAGSELMLAVDKDWKPLGYDDPKAHVRGKIDRLDIDDEGNAKVVDYKSGHRIVGINESWQIKLYSRLVMAHFPDIKVVDVELDYIRHRSVRSGRLGPDEMEAAKEWIEAVGRGIEKAAKTKSYPAKVGQACRGCSAFNTCPARATTSKPVPPEDEAAAFELVRRLILIERERKEIMESVTPWVDQYGDIEVNGMVLGYKKQVAFEFDVPTVASILEKRGLRPLRYMSVDKAEIKKLGRMDSKIAEELEKSARDTSKTVLKLDLIGENE